MSNKEVRQVRKEDLAQILEVDLRAFGEGNGYSSLVIRQHYDACPEYFLVALKDDKVQGYILAQPTLDPLKVWIQSMVTDPLSEDTHGVAYRLMAALVSRLAKAGVVDILFTIRPENLPMRRLVKRYNIPIVGEEEDYFGPNTKRWTLKFSIESLNKFSQYHRLRAA